VQDPHYRAVEKAISEGKPVPAEVLKDYPDLAKAIPKAKVPITNWKQAQIEASTRIEEIENEWIAKNLLGPTREQQGRIDNILADVAKKYSVPLSTLRKATLWEADGLIRIKRTPLTDAEIDE
ncbi:unnamed protein product, partial [marine sediment metagenome]